MQTSTTAADAWANTNVMTSMATRVMGSERYLGHDDRKLGTLVSEDAYELFTICPPAETLQLHFEHQQPTFIAVHDLGATRSTGFLTELAAALRLPLRTLTFRQQGSGASLALLRFIELPSQRGTPVRVYATASDADGTNRRQLAEVLVAFSRLGVLLVDAMTEPVLASQLGLLRDRMLSAPWTNRDLLVVPGANLPFLTPHLQRLTAGTLIGASAAAPASQTAAIWRAVHEAWSRLRGASGEAPPAATAPASVAPATPGFHLRPFGSSPASAVPSAAPIATIAPVAPDRPSAPAETAHSATPSVLPAAERMASPSAPPHRHEAYVQTCAALRGAQACVLLERRSRRALAKAGRHGDPASWVEPALAMMEASRALQSALADRGEIEMVLTLEQHVLVLRSLPRRPELALVLAFDKAQVNLALLRPQLQRLDAMLDQ